MKDLETMLGECLAELHSVGIFPGTVTGVSVNRRAKKRWGQAKRNVKTGTYSITITDRLLDDALPDWPAKNTLMHELLHCVEGCWAHTGKWKELAEKCNRELGTKIQRCSDYSDVVPRAETRSSDRRYAVRCEHCGKVIRREKRSKVIMHPEKYRCPNCGGKLRRIA